MDYFIELDYVRKIESWLKSFEELGVPALILNLDFEVVYSNAAAKREYPTLAEPDGFRGVVEEFTASDIIDSLKRDGITIISDMISFEDLRISLTPIYHEGELTAVAALFGRSNDLSKRKTPGYKSKTADVLSSGIRAAVDGIFQSLDTLIQKSDLIGADWVAPHADTIAMQSYQTLRIATNVTEYVRLQNGEMQITPSICNLSTWLEEMRDAIIGLAAQAGVPAHIMIPHEDCFVLLDMPRFETAFFNILHNAFYYTKPGNEVFITAHALTSGASLTVQDSGLGIPFDMLERACDPYFSYSHGLTAGGAGLGLTLASRIISAHGGEMKITSESGEGTTVDITLPAKTFSGALPFEQTTVDYAGPRDRFSSLYIGLAGISCSPFGGNHQ